MKLSVTSETSPLLSVVVHAPGREVDLMVPAMMHELLFDDILAGDVAEEEHAAFRRVLRAFGAEVLDAQSLLAEALADGAARDDLLSELERLGLLDAARVPELREVSAEALARTLVEGREAPAESGNPYAIPPVPNLLFMRDPAIVLHDGVVFGSMARATRRREAHLLRHVFRAAPRFHGVPVLLDLLGPAPPGAGAPTLEGGDVIVASPTTVLVGLSERTNQAGVDRLARALAARGQVETLIVVRLPETRSAMHLDTVFTFVDRDAALYFPPYFEPGRGTVRVERIALGRDVAKGGLPHRGQEGELMAALAACGIAIDPIPIGGARLVDQLREQWTDGCNALCAEPGRVLLYQRNFHTLEVLAARGYRVLTPSQLLARPDYYRHDGTRVAVTLPAAELSRARGGPRCMSMPLRRA